MNKPQPTLQAAVVTGLNLLADPDVRVPASQAEGLVALRTLLQALASGQLVVSEASAVTLPAVADTAPVTKTRAPRRTKAQIAAAANGATPPTAVAAPTATQ